MAGHVGSEGDQREKQKELLDLLEFRGRISISKHSARADVNLEESSGLHSAPCQKEMA